MNCCDEYGNCRQGRDCPVRIERVRQAKERLDRDANPWRRQLRHLAKWMLAAYLLLIYMAMLAAAVSHA